jgi:hypothetical protein
MEEPEFDDEVLEHVSLDRRAFVKRVAIKGAWAVPVVTAFSMSRIDSAFATSIGGSSPT